MLATIILICLESAGFLLNAVLHNEEKKASKYNVYSSFFVMAIKFTVFYYAGLFDKLIH